MDVFSLLKTAAPNGGVIVTPTVRCDIEVSGHMLHVPPNLSLLVKWSTDGSAQVEPMNLEATVDTAIGPFPMRARVKVTRLDMQRSGDVFAVGSWGFVNRRIQFVDMGDA